jgi:hypothetical protein
MAMNTSAAINTEALMRKILVIRGHRVLLDSELASLYQVETKGLTRAVRRNADRFPADFMYQLTAEEAGSLRCQIGALKTGRGRHRKYSPYDFTEQGVAMLPSTAKPVRPSKGSNRRSAVYFSSVNTTSYRPGCASPSALLRSSQPPSRRWSMMRRAASILSLWA